MPRDGAAARDLDWAVRVGSRARGQGGFWASALTAHTAREALRARASSREEGDAETLAFVERTTTSALSGSELASWTGWMMRPGGVRLAGGQPGPKQPPPAPEPKRPAAAPSEKVPEPRVYDKKRRRPWDLTWDPNSPPNRGETVPGKRCEVKCWALPAYWEPVAGETDQFGFWFIGIVEFVDKPEEGVYCECCVFRQFLRTSHGKQGRHLTSSDFGEDGGEGTAYGHDRPDPNRAAFGKATGAYAWPKPAAEGETPNKLQKVLRDNADTFTPFGWQDPKAKSIGCGYLWEDSPLATLTPGSSVGDYEDLWNDFLGVVYDRCNQWKLVDQRRMVLWLRASTVSKVERGQQEYVSEITDSACYSSKPGEKPEAEKGWTNEGDSSAEHIPGKTVVPYEAQRCTK